MAWMAQPGYAQADERSSADIYKFVEMLVTEAIDQNPEKITTWIENGANVNARDKHGRTPLMIAAVGTQNPEVITILVKNGADVNARDEAGLTPLMFAARNNSNLEVITALIKNGADMNARDEGISPLVKSGMTPLMMAAAINQNPEVISFLIKNGADPKLRELSGLGLMAIDFAKNNPALKNTEAYNELSAITAEVDSAIKAGADVSESAAKTEVPLMAAVESNRPEVITAPSSSDQKNQSGGLTALKQFNDDYPGVIPIIALILVIIGVACSASGRIVVFANYTDLTMSLMAFILPFVILVVYEFSTNKPDPEQKESIQNICLLLFFCIIFLTITTCVCFNWRNGRGVLGCLLGPYTKVLIACSFILMVFRIVMMFDEAKSKKRKVEQLSATILAFFWAILIAKLIMWLTRITVVYRGWEPFGDWLVGRSYAIERAVRTAPQVELDETRL
jgi:uncharacterized membrane protein